MEFALLCAESCGYCDEPSGDSLEEDLCELAGAPPPQPPGRRCAPHRARPLALASRLPARAALTASETPPTIGVTEAAHLRHPRASYM
eukprot:scaffold641_cov490-Prasinococcus_capsulatus_cf.AAC.15